MPKHIIAPVEEFPSGGRKVIEIAGRSIGIFNVNGEFYAIRNTCPHQGGPLCSGRLTGFVMAPVLEQVYADGVRPLMDGEITEEAAFDASIERKYAGSRDNQNHAPVPRSGWRWISGATCRCHR